ncbi:hypothetical protein ACRRTK_011208 [Alexandromys fortis]
MLVCLQGRVCGLCGNFDDNAINDFTTRSQSVVSDVLEFGNSWKFSPSCPDAPVPKDPCTANPYRKSWAQKKCSIINSATFAACHSQVDSTKYYEACVHDVCACDSGGDCECFCTAVAAYAQACRDVGVCLSWRTPDICPLFCDYYNPHGECEWHYQPCGAPCLKTCRNPAGRCLVDLPGLEGCYPQCPPSQPFFNEDQMKCVAQCGCYDDDGNYHDIGTQVPTAENCQSCLCTPDGIKCVHNLTACICTYEGRTYHYDDVVYNTTDGLGACLVAICKGNGTIIRTTEECPAVSSTTPFTFTNTLAPHTTTGSAPTASTVSTVCVREVCRWSIWYDESHPEPGMTGGDFETFENLRQKGYQVCQSPAAIECRAEKFPSMDLQKLGQKVNCDPSWGLKCLNSEQSPPLCYNYELRVLCCDYVPCSSTLTSGASTTHSRPEISRESSWPTHSTQSPIQSTQTTSSVSKSTPLWTTEGKETSLDTIHSSRQTVTFTSKRRATSHRIGSTNSASSLVSSSATSVFTSQTGSTSAASTVTQIISSPVTSTTCQLQCQWTGWLDTDYPTSDGEGEDIETYERIRATGADICEQPQGIQCVAQNYPDMSLDMLGQVVTCDVSFGLVCRNRDQKGDFGMCYNYMIRVLCCSVSHCQGPTTTAGSPPIPQTATTATQTLSSKPYPNTTPVETWSPSGSTSIQGSEMPTSGILTASVSSPPSTSLTAASKTTQHPRSPEFSGTPSVVTTRSTSQGHSLPPSSPHATSSFSATTSRTSLARGTTFSTSLTTPGPSYSPPGSTSMSSATAASTSRAITHSKTTPELTGAPSASTTEPLRTPTTSTSAASTVSMPVTSTTCQPQCQWTGWLDTDYPTSDGEGEDIETYERIRATGADICEQPQGIQCVAQNYPDMSLDMLGQEVTCDVNFGLVCRNRDQKGDFGMCYNYMIRVLCCSVSHCQGPTTTAGSPPIPQTATTATQTLSSKPYPNTSPVETWSPSGSTSIQGSEMPTSGILTASVSSPPSTSLTAASKTTQHPRSPEFSGTPSVVTTRSTSQGHSLPPSSPHATSSFSATTSRTSLARGTTFSTSLTTPGPSYSPPGSTSMSSATAASTSRAITHSKTTPELTGAPSASTTEPLRTPTTSTSAASTVSMPVTSTTCQPQCQWTGWLDTDYPTSDGEGEDIETYERIRATGADICEQPQGIQCVAQNYPDMSLDMLGQVVTCDVSFGLVCRNRDQKGDFGMCYNYMIRVLCCSVSHCQGPTTTAGSPTTPQTATTASSRSITHTSWPVSSIFTSTSTTESISSPGKTTILTMASSTATTTPRETRTSSWLSTGLSPALKTTRTTSTGCKFQCTWTDWLDSDKPQPGQFGGDIETYYHIRNKTGIQVCKKPVDIECEAILFPNMSFQQLGQEVVCNVDFGLICRNSKQANNQTCFNYHIRVLCCEEDMSCLSTTGSLSTTFSPVTESPHTAAPLSSTSTAAPGSPRIVSMSTNKRPSEEPMASTSLTTLRRISFPRTDRVVSTGTTGTTERLSLSSMSTSSASPTTFLQTSKEQHSGKPNTTSWTASSSTPSTAKLTMSTGTSTGFSRTITTLWRSLPPSTPTTPTKSTEPNSILMTTKNPPTLITSHMSNSHTRTHITTASSPEAVSTEEVRKSSSSTSLTTPGPPYSPPGSTSMSSATAASTSRAITHSKTTPELTGAPSASTTEPLRTPTTSTSVASTVSMPVTSTTCQPQCQWTGWLDTDYPTSDGEGEDIETYERIRATGADICEQPQGIQCVAQNYPDMSLDMLGQVVTCDVSFGLVCRNRDQKGDFGMCYNYMIRVLCCSVSHCQGPTTTAGSPPIPQTATTATQTLSSKPYPNTTPVETWSPSGSTSIQGSEMPTSGILTASVSSPPSTSLTAASKTTQHPRSPEFSGTPSVVTTRSTSQGHSLPPSSPHATSSFSATTSRTSLARGTTFSTSLTTPGPSYSPPGSTSMSSATAASTSRAITHSKTTPELTGAPSASTTEPLRTPTTSTSAASTVSMPVTSTTCQPQCQWTGWLDTDYPTSDGEGEDIETYERIRATGADICEQPQGIQCVAQNYPDMSLDMLGQEVTCDVNFGLVCRNRDQKGDFGMCYNYMIRVLCCSVSHCQGPTTTAGSPTTPQSATTATQTLSSKPYPNTSPVETWSPSGSTSIQGSEMPTSGILTASVSSPPSTSLTATSKTTQHPRSPESSGTPSVVTTRSTSQGHSLPPSSPHATSSFSATTSRTSLARGTTFSTSLTTPGPSYSPPGSTSMSSATAASTSRAITHSKTTPELTGAPSASTTEPLRTPTTSTSAASTVTHTVSTPVTSTTCQPQCQWTGWLDTDYPTSDGEGEDIETYERIRATGADICEQPQGIQCVAQNYPDMSLDMLGQEVTCDVNFGLVCRNRDQKGDFGMCYNYMIRVLCCSVSHCQGPTTTAGSPTTLQTATTATQTLSSKYQTTTSLPVTRTYSAFTTVATSFSKTPPGSSYTATTVTSSTRSTPHVSSVMESSSPGTVSSIHTTLTIMPKTLQPSTPALTTKQTSSTGIWTRILTGTAGTTFSKLPPTSLTTVIEELSTSTPRIQTLPETMTTASTSQGTTYCQPKCTWTEWFDVDSPTSGVGRGDMETYENIRASGKKMCQAPEKIECRAENYPAVSIDKVGQVVSCSLETGLVCKNEDQTDDFKMCFNYNIRVLCCNDYSHCPSTMAVPPTSTTNKPKASNEVPTKATSSSTRQRHSIKATTPSKTSDSLTTTVIHTGSIPSTHSVSSPVTSTTCQPQCQWTGWLDTDYPTSDGEGEDIETYERIRATGADICEQPQGIQCVAQNYPDMSLDMLGQVVTCDVSFGLVCRNRDQKGDFGMCYNYMIRVLCCSVSHCQGPTTTAGSPTTPQTATTATQTLSSKPYPNTSPVETWSPSGSTSIQGSEMPTSGILTASVSSPPSTSLTATSKTTQHPRSPESSGTPSVVTTRSTSQGHSLPPSSPHATSSFSATTSRTSLARGTTFSTSLTTPGPSYSPPGSTSMSSATAASTSRSITHSKTTPELTGAPSASTTEPFRTLTTSTSAASTVTHTVSTPVTSTTCQPQCQWTGWLDTDYPTSDGEGEDIETYERIRATGADICEQPQGIQCVAQNYPDMSLDMLGQEVTCDVNFGLVCRNRDQKGDFGMCYNYMIRVLCCSVSHCQGPTTTAGSPTTPQTATTATQTLSSKPYPNTSPVETWSPSGSTSIQGSEMPTSGILTASVSSPPSTSLTATSKTTQHPRSPESSGTPSVVTTRSTSQGHSLPPSSPHATSSFSATTSRTSLARGTTFSTSLTTPGPSYSPPGSTSMSSATAASTSRAITHSKTTPELTGAPSASTTEPLRTPTTSTSAASTVTHTVSTPVTSTTCQPQCQWTGWLDTDYPTSDGEGEDIETYERIRATGADICEQPQGIQCVAQNYPDMSLDMLGQEVTCDVNFGLVCRNRDQKGDFGMCYNYMIRVLCCSVSHCQGPTTTAGSPTTPRTATTARLSSTAINTSWVSPSALSHTSATSTPTSTSKENQSSSLASTRTTIISTPLSSSTGCKPQCTWSDWLDHSSPIPGSSGGEFETYANIRAAGIAICDKPLDLECDVVDQPHVPQQESNQVINCSVNFGLVCRNLDQPGPFSVCLNYRIRVLCCDDYSHCPSAPSSTRTSALPWSTHTPLVPFTTTVASSTESTFQTKHPFSSPVPSTQASTWTTLTDSGCAPRCTWTDWFDADFPNPGPRGGDFEVYAVLREVGFVFCEQPKDIQCRSEKEPDRPLETLEQVVQCDVRFGLICKNINQSGPLQYCDNYHVRLLCCDNTTHCTTPPMATPSTVPSTSTLLSTHTSPISNTMSSSPVATSSTVPHSSSLVPTPTSPVLTTATSPGATGPTAAPSSTTETTHTPELSPSSQVTFSMSTVSPLSLSTVRSTVFSSQSVSPSPCFCRAFGQLFLPGDVIYNKTDGAGCQFYATCNQNCELDRFQGACPSSSPPVPSTPLPGCDNASPPRQVNESWTLENCTVARCQGNNQIILEEPEPVDNVTCANKHLPIKVWDQEPCHFHYECECFCSGWGQSHYLTFDGTSYTFLDNCTSVLMREIHPRHGNLSILAHSYYCGATTNATFCPRALSVNYNSMEIVLTITITGNGKEESLVIWDQMLISSGYTKNGVTVSLSGTTTMSVNISTIGTSITFDGHIFQIWLPYRYFSNNTEGQCGTCTNSQTDDCRRPDGTIASNCQDMAKDWLVPRNNNNSCLAQPSPPPSTTSQPPVSSTSTSTPCPTAPLCELMLSQVFAECHRLIPPDTFFSSCVNDHCNANVTDMLCQSLEAYATLCRARGVCVNWRNATEGLCDLSCPPTKEYRPCGPLHPASCSSRTLSVSTEMQAEGCFCPENQLLFNSRMDICVQECPCVGPDGLPKFPGEHWISNCQSCVCDPSAVSVQCEPVQCESQELPQCTKAGFVTMTRPKADNPCCSETVCVCNTTTCPKSLSKCEPGHELIRIHEEGSCCPSSICRPMMCTHNDTLYGGFKYTLVPGQCCGECVQDACFTPEGQTVQPNETWVNSHVDNCTVYLCKAENGIHVLTPLPMSCPDVSNCRGTLKKIGCCYSCEKEDSSTCQVRVSTTILRHKGCETEMAVNVTFCEGSCSGTSKYSLEVQAMEHQCTCCQESKVHDVAVAMQCPNGTVIQHTYTHVDECSCALACRSPPMASMNTP